MKRNYSAPTQDKRCKADITVGKIAKEGAQCMKAAKVDGHCRQHDKMRKAQRDSDYMGAIK